MKEREKLDMGRGCDFDKPQPRICEGCFKLHETNWLETYPEQGPSTDIFEVRFKNTRRGYYKNIHNLPLKRGDVVAVEASPGYDIGIVSLTGDMVARQMRRTGFVAQNGEFRSINRKAKPYDIEKWQQAIAQEHPTMIHSRQIAERMGLDMKIGDVEYQGDRAKAIFYYIADGRVDFRELIKVFASEFGIKIEMKQIGARQEAGRIGGLGSCGRELCCSSWVASFNSVNTGAARTQDISLNPQKLAGQCCKLKCCLSYELDAYLDARRSLPRVHDPLQALDGDYHLVATNVLQGTMSFSTVKGSQDRAIVLPAAKVREVQDMNRRGQKPDTITGLAPRHPVEEPAMVNMVGEESITRFDKQRGSGRGRGGRDRRREGEKRAPQAKREGVELRENHTPKPDGERREGNRGRDNRHRGPRRQGGSGNKNQGGGGGQNNRGNSGE